MFRGSLLCFTLFLLPLILSLDITENSMSLSFLHPPCSYLYTLRSFSLSLFFSKINTSNTLSLSSQERCFLVIFMAFCCALLSFPSLSCTEEPRAGSCTPIVASSVMNRREGSPALSCWQHSYSSPGYHQHSLLQRHIAGSYKIQFPPRPL